MPTNKKSAKRDLRATRGKTIKDIRSAQRTQKELELKLAVVKKDLQSMVTHAHGGTPYSFGDPTCPTGKRKRK